MFKSTGGIILPTDDSAINLTAISFGNLNTLGQYTILVQNTGSVAVHLGPIDGVGSSSYLLGMGREQRFILDGDSLYASGSGGSVTVLAWF